MAYILLFLEGIITFISPCLLPLLPLYISYFASGESQETPAGKRRTLANALGFISGFTLLFVSMGAFAGALGSILREYSFLVNILCGALIILFGLNSMGVISVPFLNATYRKNANVNNLGGFSSALFGIIFAVSWTPCAGPFLGTALMQATLPASAWQGALMLFIYAMGLGLPFLLCALIIDKLKGAFAVIKNHYKIINIISGLFLILIGIVMMTGYMGYLMALLAV